MDIDQVLTIHKKLIQEFGGIQGLRDKEMLESALSRPFQTFDGRELYPSIEEKAAAILESLLLNHPFIDGNKRIGYTLFRLLILSENKDIISSMDERYELVVSIASGKIKFDKILEWIKGRVVILNG